MHVPGLKIWSLNYFGSVSGPVVTECFRRARHTGLCLLVVFLQGRWSYSLGTWGGYRICLRLPACKQGSDTKPFQFQRYLLDYGCDWAESSFSSRLAWIANSVMPVQHGFLFCLSLFFICSDDGWYRYLGVTVGTSFFVSPNHRIELWADPLRDPIREVYLWLPSLVTR